MVSCPNQSKNLSRYLADMYAIPRGLLVPQLAAVACTALGAVETGLTMVYSDFMKRPASRRTAPL